MVILKITKVKNQKIVKFIKNFNFFKKENYKKSIIFLIFNMLFLKYRTIFCNLVFF